MTTKRKQDLRTADLRHVGANYTALESRLAEAMVTNAHENEIEGDACAWSVMPEWKRDVWRSRARACYQAISARDV